MLNMVINSIKFNNRYNTNAFIYRLRRLPIIGKYIPKELYNDYFLEIIINLIVFLYTIISPFIGKFIYLSIFIGLPMEYFNNSNSFVHIFVFLTLIGGILNTDMFNPSKSKYYSVVLMRMNPKKYAISNFIYFCFKLLISFYPSILFLGLMYNVNIWILILLPIFVVLIKFISNMLLLKIYDKRQKVVTENNFLVISLTTIIGMALAYLLPYLRITINYIGFVGIFILCLILGILSLKYILENNNYGKIYKRMLTLNNVIFDANEVNQNNLKKNYSAKIENINVTSNKKGYAYFNDIFYKRHSSLLNKSAIKFALIIFVILVGIGIVSYFSTDIKLSTNNMILNGLPYFVFIMYFINRGSVVTQAMFINCDHSMLAYRFYKTPKVILRLFRERLLTVIKINMIPTIILSIGLPLLLYVTGGTNNILDYGLIFLSIIFLSIFFSVHHLVLYYLLQPYDINMKAKSNTYSIINGITYLVCYSFIDINIPTTMFTVSIIIFSLLYVIVSLFLVYKYAPITFKLKQ